MTLTDFTEAVNRLARAECDDINAKGNIFAAVHHDFPESMMRYYHEKGMTPQEAFEKILNND